ncbi:MAG: hypothetical protein Tsb009_05780 [Planctomycetaceae bacterium]
MITIMIPLPALRVKNIFHFGGNRNNDPVHALLSGGPGSCKKYAKVIVKIADEDHMQICFPECLKFFRKIIISGQSKVSRVKTPH